MPGKNWKHAENDFSWFEVFKHVRGLLFMQAE